MNTIDLIITKRPDEIVNRYQEKLNVLNLDNSIPSSLYVAVDDIRMQSEAYKGCYTEEEGVKAMAIHNDWIYEILKEMQR